MAHGGRQVMKIFRKWFFPDWQPVWTETGNWMEPEDKGGMVWDTATYIILYSEVRNKYKLLISGFIPTTHPMYKVAVEKLNKLKGIKI